jgi:replicative DNA helicase
MEIKPLTAYLSETEDVLNKRTSDPDLPITALPSLNNKTWGLPRGKMTIIGARTSMGKTAFALQIILDMLTNNKSVLYLSFEMKPQEIAERLFCNKYKIDNFELLVGKFSEYQPQWESFTQFLNNSKLIIADGFGKTWKELTDFMNTLTKQPDVVILDYIQSIAGSSVEGKGFIDEYIRKFRELAISKGYAGVIVSQINRSNPDAKDKSPQLHQLKGTGYLEEHADLIILLNWVYKTQKIEDKSLYELNVAKNRSGRTGYIKLRYLPQYYLFEDWAHEEGQYDQMVKSLNKELKIPKERK